MTNLFNNPTDYAGFKQNAHLLIIDDEPTNVLLLQELLGRWGYHHVESTTDSRRAEGMFLADPPDLILLDLSMPYLSGYEVMERLRQHLPQQDQLPVIVLTADHSKSTKLKALASGAKDFLSKPLDVAELRVRIENMLQTRYLQLSLQAQKDALETKVRDRTQALENAQIEMLERLGQAAEFRDDDTGQHTRRVGQIAAMVARLIGVDEEYIDLLRRAAPLHDVGKIGIPDSILLKPDRLTPEEFAQMKCHTLIGHKLLQHDRSAPVMMAAEIALYHHERWDGSGYPQGLSNGSIPRIGQVVAVADVFDALTHRRPYKEPWPVAAAVEEIRSQSGRQFDPEIAAAFLTLPHEELV